MKEALVFFKEFIREFKTTGALLPTTKWAAKAMTSPLQKRSDGKGIKILELGSGTGSVTGKILENMGYEDTLTVCEINPRLMSCLKEHLSSNKYFKTHKSRLTFHCCAMQNLPESSKFDVIVCAISFLNFEMPLITQMFAKLRKLSHSETVMTYYEFAGLRKINMTFSPPQRRSRIKQLDSFFNSVFEKHLMNKEKVWLNMPPINVMTLQNLDELKIAV